MTGRRFDTDTLLQQLLAGDAEAFKAFYERYRGRVYRFIARQCGNGEEGEAVFLSVWAHLIDVRVRCSDYRSLKLAFLVSLRRPCVKPSRKDNRMALLSLIPRDPGEESGWSTLLIDLIRRLPDGLRQRLLFRYEIGLGCKAIALLFREGPETTQRYLEEAELLLRDGLLQAGCNKQIAPERLYRETRVVNPPSSWDNEVMLAYSNWMREGVSSTLLEVLESPDAPGRRRFMQRLHKTLRQFRSDLADKARQAQRTNLSRP